MGEKIATLVDEYTLPGVHSVQWDASALPSAIYFSRLRSGTNTAISKMLLLK